MLTTQLSGSRPTSGCELWDKLRSNFICIVLLNPRCHFPNELRKEWAIDPGWSISATLLPSLLGGS